MAKLVLILVLAIMMPFAYASEYENIPYTPKEISYDYLGWLLDTVRDFADKVMDPNYEIPKHIKPLPDEDENLEPPIRDTQEKTDVYNAASVDLEGNQLTDTQEMGDFITKEKKRFPGIEIRILPPKDDVMKSGEDGVLKKTVPDPIPIIEHPPIKPPYILCMACDIDPDSDMKGGGKDPIVVGDWWYYEVDTEKCRSPRIFDFDNDGFKENFCYEIIGKIFVIDFGDGISHGYNMLNFHRTQYDGMSPYQFLQKYPNVCKQYDCYLWKDSVRNWTVDDGELEPYSLVISDYADYPNGIKSYQHPDGGTLRYIYGQGITDDGHKMYSLKPVYWERGLD